MYIRAENRFHLSTMRESRNARTTVPVTGFVRPRIVQNLSLSLMRAIPQPQPQPHLADYTEWPQICKEQGFGTQTSDFTPPLGTKNISKDSIKAYLLGINLLSLTLQRSGRDSNN